MQDVTTWHDFSGKVVVVTGGARGVGRAIAERFLSVGADVVVCGRTEPEDDVLPRATGPTGAVHQAFFATADVRDAEAVTELMRTAVERFGRIDVLVNNAGGSPQVPAASASPRFSASIVALNLLAPIYCSQAANTVMQEQDSGGVIVNIGSVSGVRPSPGTAAYGAAKAGLVSLTTSLAIEWAPKVRVNCITAGLLWTGAWDDHYGGEVGRARIAATIPLGRFGSPDDVADACLYLSSPVSSYVSGANLLIHGGGERPAFLDAAGNS